MRVNIGPIVVGLAALLQMGSSQALAQQASDSEASRQVATRRYPDRALQSPLLRRAIAVDLRDATLVDAIQAIARLGDLKLLYGEAALRSRKSVTLHSASIRVSDALAAVLQETGLSLLVSPSGQLVVAEKASVPPRRQGTITGRVTDSAAGRPITAAEVFLEKTQWRTVTDSSGRYSLTEVDTGRYTLTVRRLGYAKLSRAVTVRDGRTDTVNVALRPTAARLDEIVATATGRQRRIELANDITTIKADSVMQTQPVSSVTDLLEGRVPGLVVQRTSGAPGDPARLRIRGAASALRSNDPIVVVDGIRVYAEQSAARSGNLTSMDSVSSTNFAAPSPIDYIDPNSIETIEIFKGPSAATLYGPDAANGVIVITTKKGRVGPPQWTAMAEYGQNRMAGRYPDLFFPWGHSLSDNTPQYCPNSFFTQQHFLNTRTCIADSVASFQILNDPNLTILDKGSRAALTLGVRGGSSALTYSLTGSYQEETGLVKLPAYEADNYVARLGTSVPDWMQRPQRLRQWSATSQIGTRLGSRADLSFTTRLSRTMQQRSSLERNIGMLSTTYLDRSSGTYYFQAGGATDILPVTSTELGYFTRATAAATALTTGMNVNWRPKQWLNVAAEAGLNINQRDDEIFVPRNASTAVLDSTGALAHGNGVSIVNTLNARANVTVPLRYGFRFLFATGVNYTGRSIRDQVIRTTNLAPGTELLGRDILAGGISRLVENDATFGWYLAPSVNNDRIFLDMGLRLDGGSTYGGGDGKLPRFPKIGLSYLLSDEPFFPLKDLVQSFRVRVAYGKAGRQPGPTDRLRLYAARQLVWVDSQFVDGQLLQTLGNTELRPERTAEIEGGFDADLLDNRLRLSVSGYRKTTDDALINMPLAPSIYGDRVTVLRNIGVIRNTGLEVTVGAQLVRSGPVTWGTDLSISQNRSVVVALGAGQQAFYTNVGGTGGTGFGGTRVAVGYPLFGNWALPILGYADGNGNGTLEFYEAVVGDTAVYVGQNLPNYTASLHTTVSLWRGAVAVSGGFQYEDGLSQYNTNTRRYAAFSAAVSDPSTSVAEQVAMIGMAGTDYNFYQTVSTLRLNSLSVQYRAPTAVARRIGAQQLAISVQGTNLGLWTNYRGLDPSVNSYGTGNRVSDTGVLPQPRTWQVRINASY